MSQNQSCNLIMNFLTGIASIKSCNPSSAIPTGLDPLLGTGSGVSSFL